MATFRECTISFDSSLRNEPFRYGSTREQPRRRPQKQRSGSSDMMKQRRSQTSLCCGRQRLVRQPRCVSMTSREPERKVYRRNIIFPMPDRCKLRSCALSYESRHLRLSGLQLNTNRLAPARGVASLRVMPGGKSWRCWRPPVCSAHSLHRGCPIHVTSMFCERC